MLATYLRRLASTACSILSDCNYEVGDDYFAVWIERRHNGVVYTGTLFASTRPGMVRISGEAYTSNPYYKFTELMEVEAINEDVVKTYAKWLRRGIDIGIRVVETHRTAPPRGARGATYWYSPVTNMVNAEAEVVVPVRLPRLPLPPDDARMLLRLVPDETFLTKTLCSGVESCVGASVYYFPDDKHAVIYVHVAVDAEKAGEAPRELDRAAQVLKSRSYMITRRLESYARTVAELVKRYHTVLRPPRHVLKWAQTAPGTRLRVKKVLNEVYVNGFNVETLCIWDCSVKEVQRVTQELLRRERRQPQPN